MRNFIRLIVLTATITISSQSHARYSTYAEAPVEVNTNNITIDVKKSGKIFSTHEKEITILNEIGRQNYGSQTLYFIKNISEIVDIEAKTIYEDKEYVVEKKHIEIKPLASSENGFDQKYQILISFPQVLVGSKLYLKYKENLLIPSMKNEYEDIINLGVNEYVKESNIKLTSEIPIKTLVNDPDHNLIVKENNKDGKYYISIAHNKPIYYALSNEPSKVLDEKKLSYVSISSLKSYSDVSRYFAQKYNEVSDQKLPELFQKILDGASNHVSEIDQINYITSELANKIRYMGQWGTIDGQLFPRDLEVVATTGFGDCKDYSTITVAILKKLGYKAKNAFVFRGINYIQNDNLLPNQGSFNHAILTATGKSGKKYWIDPTNFVSMAGKSYFDISRRSAVVLDVEDPGYEDIPETNSKNSGITLYEQIKLSNDIEVNSTLNIFGEKAAGLTGAELYTSKQAIEEFIITSFSGETKPIAQKAALPSLTSRIVKDIKIDFSYKKEDDLIRSNIEKAVKLPLLALGFTNGFIQSSEDDVGALHLGEPSSYIYKTTIKNYTAETPEKLNFNIKNKWFAASRKCYKNGNDIVIEENAELFYPIIYAEDIKSPSFKKIKQQIKNNMLNSILIGKSS